MTTSSQALPNMLTPILVNDFYTTICYWFLRFHMFHCTKVFSIPLSRFENNCRTFCSKFTWYTQLECSSLFIGFRQTDPFCFASFFNVLTEKDVYSISAKPCTCITELDFKHKDIYTAARPCDSTYPLAGNAL